MNPRLDHIRVAILATDGFEQSELFEPKRALERAGAEVAVVSPRDGQIFAWKDGDWGKPCRVDLSLEDVANQEFDALVLPGGVMNPDRLRIHAAALEFIQSFASAGKPIAAICHGPWPLIELGLVDGKTMTSWPSLRTDLENAGAYWVDRNVVVDGGLITSRKPEDIPMFIDSMISVFENSTGLARNLERSQAAASPNAYFT